MHKYIIVLIVCSIAIGAGALLVLNRTSVSKEKYNTPLATTSPETSERPLEITEQESPAMLGNTATKNTAEARIPASTASSTQPVMLEKKNQPSSLSDQDIEDARFKMLTDAIVSRQETQQYLARSSTDVVAPPEKLFQKWVRLLYGDSLIIGITRIDPTDPVRSELMTAYRTDSEPTIGMLKKCKLGDIPETRTIALITRIQEQRGKYKPEDASFIARESEYLLTKSIGRLHSHYMSNMKALLSDAKISIEEKIAYVRRFIAIGDLEMALYPLEYFEEVAQNDPSLSPNQISMVNELVKEIKTQ